MNIQINEQNTSAKIQNSNFTKQWKSLKIVIVRGGKLVIAVIVISIDEMVLLKGIQALHEPPLNIVLKKSSWSIDMVMN